MARVRESKATYNVDDLGEPIYGDENGRSGLGGLLQQPIAFHRPLARLCESVTAGLMLSQAVYWQHVVDSGRGGVDGWFFKSADDWTAETMLSRREQEGARSILRSFVVVVDGCPRRLWWEKLAGVPARLHFHVDFLALEYLLRQNKFSQKGESSFDKLVKLDSPKSENLYGGFGETIYTETTTEITTETTALTAAPAPQLLSLIPFENATATRGVRPRKPKAVAVDSTPRPAAVDVYREVMRFYPHKSLWPMLVDVTDLDKWREILTRWLAVGGGPKNVETPLHYYHHGWDDSRKGTTHGSGRIEDGLTPLQRAAQKLTGHDREVYDRLKAQYG